MSEYKYEYRQAVVPLTVSENSDEKRMIVEGKAISFNSPTVLFEENGIEYKEVISERALDNTDMKDVLMKINHDQKGNTLARTRNNSLVLEVRNDGLYFTATLPNTQFGRDAYENIRSGLTPDMSFGFLVSEEHFDKDSYTRSIDGIKYIREISICDIGAYPDCYVQARDFFSVQEEMIKQQEEEQKRSEYEALRKKLLLRTYF